MHHETSQTAGVMIADALTRYSPASLTAVAKFEAASEAASGTFWLLIESPAVATFCHVWSSWVLEYNAAKLDCITLAMPGSKYLYDRC